MRAITVMTNSVKILVYLRTSHSILRSKEVIEGD
jgi:hypothetical protein